MATVGQISDASAVVRQPAKRLAIQGMSLQLSAWLVLSAAALLTGQSWSSLFGAGLLWVLCGVPTAIAIAWFTIERVQRGQFEASPPAQHRLVEVITTLNGMAPEMAATLAGSAQASSRSRTWIEVGDLGELINIENGRVIKVVTATGLELLRSEQRGHLRTHAASLSQTHSQWAKLYPKRNSILFPFMRRRLDQRLRQLAAGTREHLDGVVAILRSLGIEPDDNYLKLRGLMVSSVAEGEGV